MTDILITGSNGLVGSALVEHLAELGRDFDGLDRGEPVQHSTSEHGFHQLDLADFGAVRALVDRLRPRVVIHTAALTAVDACESQRDLAWKVNVEATAALAAACESIRARLIYVSTDYVFDGHTGNYAESAGVAPLGVYGTSKAAGELAARMLCSDCVIARTSVPFGSYAHVKKDFVRWLRDELSAKRSVRIVTDQISNPTYVRDLARMLLLLSDDKFRGVVHVAGATSLDRFDFAKRVAEAFGLPHDLIHPIRTSDLKQAAQRPMNASMNVSHAHALGLAPRSIADALHEFAASELASS